MVPLTILPPPVCFYSQGLQAGTPDRLLQSSLAEGLSQSNHWCFSFTANFSLGRHSQRLFVRMSGFNAGSFQWPLLSAVLSLVEKLLTSSMDCNVKCGHLFLGAISLMLFLRHLHLVVIGFLAALSSSRRLVVCPSVRLSVGWSVGPSEYLCEKVSFRVINE